MTDRIVLPRDGRERAVLTITGDPPFTADAEVDVQLVGTSTWYPAAIVSGPDPIVAQVILVGPDNSDQTAALPVAASGLYRVRVLDEGETILRGGGYIALAD